MKDKLTEVTKLLYALGGGFEYHPASYTCIQEFTDNFAEHHAVAPEYTASPVVPKPEWIPEAPYPQIYTKDYKKTILTVQKG